MGLLDDAIREHLELKRRRGDDPAEVQRAEQDALGPIIRRDSRHDAEPGSQDTPDVADEHAVEPLPTPEPAEPDFAWEDDDAPPSDETHEYDVEQALTQEKRATPAPSGDPAAAPADEDVLEETPDFLQETPEHDRLWFEQRPPRDFDFDG